MANQIAADRQARAVGTQVAGMVPNVEQEAILAAAAEEGLKVLVVAAGAGTGKTATLKMLEQTLRGSIQYTAFNSSLVAESKAKFVKANCNTTHSLAFGAVGRLYKHRLGGERMTSAQVAKILDIEPLSITIKGAGAPDSEGKPTNKIKVLQPSLLAGQVTVAVRQFCQSADREIETKHFKRVDGIGQDNNNHLQAHLLSIAHKAWTDLTSVDGTLPFSHDVYVKLWQLGEGENKPIIQAANILLDEAQDTAPVFLDVIKQQTHALLIMVGDDNQSIYEWRGAVNAMTSFKGAQRLMLSQSYRFGQAVADVANAVLRTLDEPTELVMRGLPSIKSKVEGVANPKCYLYRTNAGAVSCIMTAIEEKKKPHLVGGGDDIAKWCQAALDLKAGRGTRHPELCCFDTWKEVVEYSKTDEGDDLKLMVKLIEKFGAAKIKASMDNMPDEVTADLVVCTAHKSKGREWDTVKLGADFPPANRMVDSDRRLLYVAATRAKLILDITECTPFCGSYQQRGDDTVWVPGIPIEYTKLEETEQVEMPPEPKAEESQPIPRPATARSVK